MHFSVLTTIVFCLSALHQAGIVHSSPVPVGGAAARSVPKDVAADETGQQTVPKRKLYMGT